MFRLELEYNFFGVFRPTKAIKFKIFKKQKHDHFVKTHHQLQTWKETMKVNKLFLLSMI